MKFKEIIVKTIDVANGTYTTDYEGIINPIQPREIYLVPIPFTTEHERYVTDNNGVVSKQSSGGTEGEFVPLTGTRTNKPITGALQLAQTSYFQFSDSSSSAMTVLNGSNCFTTMEQTGIRSSAVNQWYHTVDFVFSDLVESEEVSFSISKESGVTSSQDFSEIVNPLAFAQQKYVDEAVASAGGGGDFIPLSGTEPEKPLTNPIQYAQTGSNDIAIYSGSLESGDIRSLNFGSDGDVRLSTYSGFGSNQIQANIFNIAMTSADYSGSNGSNFKLEQNNLNIDTYTEDGVNSKISINGSQVVQSTEDSNSKFGTYMSPFQYIIETQNKSTLETVQFTTSGIAGISSNKDFSGNNNPLDFVQRKFVTDAILASDRKPIRALYPESGSFSGTCFLETIGNYYYLRIDGTVNFSDSQGVIFLLGFTDFTYPSIKYEQGFDQLSNTYKSFRMETTNEGIRVVIYPLIDDTSASQIKVRGVYVFPKLIPEPEAEQEV